MGRVNCANNEVVVFSPACMYNLSLKLSLQKNISFDVYNPLVYEGFDVATSSAHPLNMPYILC